MTHDAQDRSGTASPDQAPGASSVPAPGSTVGEVVRVELDKTVSELRPAAQPRNSEVGQSKTTGADGRKRPATKADAEVLERAA